MEYKYEMHTHTGPVSQCGRVAPKEILRMYMDKGYSGIVLTDHYSPLTFYNHNYFAPQKKIDFYLQSYREMKKIAPSDFTVMLGVELRHYGTANDYLVYGVSPGDIEKMIRLIPYGITEFYKEIKTRENIIFQAHPFRNGMTLAPLDSIDGIETFNMHPGHNSRVAVACRYAAEHSLLVSGGTDYHHPGHHAMCLMRTNERVDDSYDIARILKTKDFLFDLSGALVIPRI